MKARVLHDGPTSFAVEYEEPSPFGPDWPPEWTYWGSFTAKHLAECEARLLESRDTIVVYETLEDKP